MWTCSCRSLSDHLVSLLESAGVRKKQSPIDTAGLLPGIVSDVTCVEGPQEYQPNPSVPPHSRSGRSEASRVAASVPSNWHSSRVFFRELGAQSFCVGGRPNTRGYKSLISPAAHERLERISQRNEELCQRLSGWSHAFLPPAGSCLLLVTAVLTSAQLPVRMQQVTHASLWRLPFTVAHVCNLGQVHGLLSSIYQVTFMTL